MTNSGRLSNFRFVSGPRLAYIYGRLFVIPLLENYRGGDAVTRRKRSPYSCAPACFRRPTSIRRRNGTRNVDWKDAIPIILGWFLGLLGAQFTHLTNRFWRRKALHKGLGIELTELRIRLAGYTFIVFERFGTLTTDKLEWLERAYGDYIGQYPTPEVRMMLEFRSSPYGEIMQLNAMRQAQPGQSKSFPKVQLRYLDAKSGELDVLDEETQAILFEIRAQIENLNGHIDRINEFNRLTFDPDIAPHNLTAIKNNEITACRQLGVTCENIVERILLLETRLDVQGSFLSRVRTTMLPSNRLWRYGAYPFSWLPNKSSET